eukprot:TRINITY_DN100782_c0_g1_i1.p1 TRINITY_DN100782_c0_g1~~TRINITY_DN100782_c0_g1_i1.p1  ORF type:complete len:487 (+),score=86.04 TRINITY_DN100782_c0_g1_i1:184-1644(+)
MSAFSKLWSLTQAAWLVAGGSEDAEKGKWECAEAYGLHHEEFFERSGAETRWQPRDQMGDYDLSWRNRYYGREDIGLPTLGWLGTLLKDVQRQLSACKEYGGRYWEVNVNVTLYLEMMTKTSMDALKEYCPSFFRTPSFRLSMCTPRICEGQTVATVLTQMEVTHRLCHADHFILPEPRPHQVEAFELADWSELSLDFVIMGVQTCGTSSLWQNLAKHPEIGFTHDLESDTDYFFALTTQTRLLPTVEQVQDFNGQWTTSRPRPPIVGLRHVVLMVYALQRMMVAQIPNLRAIVVVCEPLGRLEKYLHTRCQNALRESHGDAQTSADVVTEYCEQQYLPQLFHMPGSASWRDFMSTVFLAEHLQDLQTLLGERLIIFHQDQMKEETSRTFYNDLAARLGAATPFPDSVTFGRYNSVRGRRSGLCGNASLVQALKKTLEPDYRAIERALAVAGQGVPQGLLQRKTRCDDSAALAEHPPCDQFTQCRY